MTASSALQNIASPSRARTCDGKITIVKPKNETPGLWVSSDFEGFEGFEGLGLPDCVPGGLKRVLFRRKVAHINERFAVARGEL